MSDVDQTVTIPARTLDSCAFCRIVSGSEPGEVVFEDVVSVAFLDRRPLFPGHVLLVPRDHYETLVDLPDSLVGGLFNNARLMARAVESALDAEGTFVAINNRVSQSVPHLHVHVVPRRRGDGLRGFFWPRRKYADNGEIARVKNKLISTIREMLESD